MVDWGWWEGLTNQLNVYFERGTGLNAKRRKKENTAGADICRLQRGCLRVTLSGYPLYAQRQRKPGAGVGPPFARATHDMCGDALYPARLLLLPPFAVSSRLGHH